MSNIKLVAFDLDGTTVPMYGLTPSESFCDCITEGSRRGIIFAPFTGRTMTTIPERIMQLTDIRYISYANGAGIFDNKLKSYIYQNLMPVEVCMEMLKYLARYDLPIQVFSNGVLVMEQRIYDDPIRYSLLPHHRKSVESGTAILVPSMEQFLLEKHPNVDKINIVKVIGEDRAAIISDLAQNDKIYVVSSGGTNLEINSIGTTKGNALVFLAKHLGINLEAVMAIGDNDNDIAMLEAAGLGVAVENASQAAKKAADFITESQENDGAVTAIKRFVLDNCAVEL